MILALVLLLLASGLLGLVLLVRGHGPIRVMAVLLCSGPLLLSLFIAYLVFWREPTVFLRRDSDASTAVRLIADSPEFRAALSRSEKIEAALSFVVNEGTAAHVRARSSFQCGAAKETTPALMLVNVSIADGRDKGKSGWICEDRFFHMFFP